jgi:hypothetical protein
MFHHHRKDAPVPPVESRRVASVRLLQGHEELQAAVERAREFERRRADEYQRRVGTYDRFLHVEEGSAAVVVPIDSRPAAPEQEQPPRAGPISVPAP